METAQTTGSGCHRQRLERWRGRGWSGLLAVAGCVAWLLSQGQAVAASAVSIRIWEVATGLELRTCSGHERAVTALAFSPDGQRLASGSGTPECRLWEVATGRELRSYRADRHLATEGWIRSVQFSADGTRLITARDRGTVAVWEVSTGRLLREFTGPMPGFRAAAFAGDGRVAIGVKADEASVYWWDVESGQTLRVVEEARLGGTRFYALLVGGEAQSWWDAQTSAQVFAATLPDQSEISKGALDHAAISPDGRILLTWSGVSVGPRAEWARGWEVAGGKRLWTATEFPGFRPNVCFSPDGKQFLTTSDQGAAQLWDIATGKVLRLLGPHQKATAIALGPKGARAFTWGVDHTLRVWALADGRQLGSFAVPVVRALAVAPDGLRLATGDLGGASGP